MSRDISPYMTHTELYDRQIKNFIYLYVITQQFTKQDNFVLIRHNKNNVRHFINTNNTFALNKFEIKKGRRGWGHRQ